MCVFNKDISFAQLTQQQLEKVRALEQELRSHLDKKIVLLAYDDKEDIAQATNDTRPI